MEKLNQLRESAQVQTTKSIENYVDIFLKEVSTKAKDGKTVYIRPDFHKKLNRIVQVIGENKVSVYTYINNLLEHHFNEFEQEITTSFNEKNKPIF
ncbi:DUF3408 domain-containing protein [Myroides odoratimimus]|uniref:DUF3408 domain-containing protein n=1 Tax=Myroides odoratimimus TaxID=76832 RepID=UPI00257769E6|nr:DUF3408 domain-containing protein [Myroides odoratimimus]MDM1060118.1 DUF3408 domain-containing protein [Myroides odoratimimus]MDM1514768.1 DUF3408 domain-containing protein [Myroides odoratimimus]MDM1537518.1 DUF3408 domain-containing protein [Myroides odoratimimus]MDM1677071.1 DUF3408 domain-containing protein [Myroides odoratimimus]